MSYNSTLASKQSIIPMYISSSILFMRVWSEGHLILVVCGGWGTLTIYFEKYAVHALAHSAQTNETTNSDWGLLIS
jgi:hypothetical protein